jgi:hypothetical protein
MTPKITPSKKVKRFEKYNCGGKLRVQVNKEDGEITEVILLTKKGGCKYNLQLIGRLITFILECNISLDHLLQVLEDNEPCPAPILRQKRENLPMEEVGVGGCSKIILEAMKSKMKEGK